MKRNYLILSFFRRRLFLILVAFCMRGSAALFGQELKEFDSDYLEAPAGGPELQQAEDEILRFTNDFREKQRLKSLTTNQRLQKAAAYFAAYMARTDKFGHKVDGNSPAERLTAFEYDYCIEAENIAYQMKSTKFMTDELARKLFESWKNSPPHRENLLDPDLREIGIAIGYAPDSQRYYAVQDFGRPKSAALHFEVTNKTEDTLHYSVATTGRQKPVPKMIKLPPDTKMVHARCRPSTIDWAWTKQQDAVNTRNGLEFIVTKSASGYRVVEQQTSQSRPRN